MKPCTHPIYAFWMLKEIVRVIRDIVIGEALVDSI
jgi:hypothetical protein